MRVCHISYSDNLGGAARATFRIHQALLGSKCASNMMVEVNKSGHSTVISSASKLRRSANLFKPALSQLVMSRLGNANSSLCSPAIFPSNLDSAINRLDCDVVHLHWVCGEMISIEAIGRINKPIVWTMHDMWPFCGPEHYAPDGDEARWRHGYRRLKKNSIFRGLDINRWVWLRKQKAWRTPMHMVATTKWLAKCAETSQLMSNWSISSIPYPLDVSVFQPWSKEISRKILGIPNDKRVILFGAIGGTQDPRKGWDLLKSALHRLATTSGEYLCVIFGQHEPHPAPILPFPTRWMGHLYDDYSLALLYSAADVMVVPSRQEAFGQTASEAQACGTPVVAFNATGLADVVEDRMTGYLAKPFESDDLADGIEWILKDVTRYAKLQDSARKRATALWSPSVIADQYLSLYTRILA